MSAQRVVLSDKLATYLQKKGLHYVLMDVAFCKSCGGAVGELFAHPMKDAEAEEALGRAGIRKFPCEGERGKPLQVGGASVELIVANPTIELDPVVRLSPRPLLGCTDLRVEGARY
ncbi:hypothetical protein [uncultured Adlercreutzia sp.]|uniref:hypothetical protein n=1 Tax=uncultured Adlercreutzia sp. TaxID=875803 RepID=UPI0025D8C2E9|nr:hypothetical protein [uncultured Adlercreutzia sp.]MCI9262008.1 hypothetical protein [Eggerthellaceae bacterium]